MKLFKNPLFYLCLVLVLVSGMMVISFVKAQSSSKVWEEPAEQFPGGVTSNPIDESSGSQFKIKDDDGKGQLGAYEIGIPNGSGDDLDYPRMTEDGLCLSPSGDGTPGCINKWSQVSGAWTSGDDGLYYNGGNVGIGTTNPVLNSNATGLNIAGEAGQKDEPQDGKENISMLRITDLVADYGSDTATVGEKRGGIEFYSNETSGDITGVVSAIYDVNENTYNTRHGLAFYTAGNDAPREVMRITNRGRVGIGTTEPSNSLHVDGNGMVLSRGGSLSARMGVEEGTKRFFIAPAESDGNGWDYQKELTFNPGSQRWKIEGNINITGDIYQNGELFEGGESVVGAGAKCPIYTSDEDQDRKGHLTYSGDKDVYDGFVNQNGITVASDMGGHSRFAWGDCEELSDGTIKIIDPVLINDHPVFRSGEIPKNGFGFKPALMPVQKIPIKVKEGNSFQVCEELGLKQNSTDISTNGENVVVEYYSDNNRWEEKQGSRGTDWKYVKSVTCGITGESAPSPIKPSITNISQYDSGEDEFGYCWAKYSVSWSNESNTDYYELENYNAYLGWCIYSTDTFYDKTSYDDPAALSELYQPGKYRVRACNNMGCSDWEVSDNLRPVCN